MSLTRSLCSALLGVVTLVIAAATSAEITTDGSIGAPATSIATDPLTNSYQIDANVGSLNGGNLFHSFATFNVETGYTATFAGPATVTNIIARVTGSEASTINGGVISDIAGANLWLLNRNGIHFGEGAYVNVDGAFYASTADSIEFTNGVTFSSQLAGTQILTAAEPAAFGFLTESTNYPAQIKAEALQLDVAEDQSINLVANEVSLVTSTFNAPDGNINLVSVGQSGGEVAILGQDLDASGLSEFGSIQISNTVLNVTGDQLGNVQFKAREMEFDTHDADYVNTFTGAAPAVLEQTSVLSKPCGLPVFSGQASISFIRDDTDGEQEFNLEVGERASEAALDDGTCAGLN